MRLAPNVARLKRQTDKQINEIVNRRCSGLQINIMDIGQVFKAGYVAIAEGRDLESAIVDTYRVLSINGDTDGCTIQFETL